MTTLATVRRFALSLPGATEEDHHGMASFRVATKIFATVPDGSTVRIFIAPDEVEVARGIDPAAYAEVWWGKKLCGVSVDLARARAEIVSGMLVSAWRMRAPKKLLAAYPSR